MNCIGDRIESLQESRCLRSATECAVGFGRTDGGFDDLLSVVRHIFDAT
jgi:hypothetical protein